MTLNQLIYFQTICELKSISKAAEFLHISQPSVSNAMKNLEQELNVKLFNRSSKKFGITKNGEQFLKRVNTILDEVNNAVLEMRDASTNMKEDLKIGIPPMICNFVLPEIFTDFHKKNPNIELKIFEYGSEEIKKLLQKNKLDFGIIIGTNNQLESKIILRSEINVCISRNHKFNDYESIAITDLKDEPIIMLKKGFYHYTSIMQQFSSKDIVPNILFYSDQIATIKDFVQKDIGISFLLKEIIQNDSHINNKPLIPPHYVDIGLVRKKDRYISKVCNTFINYINNHFENI